MFDEIERDAHSAISADSYRALKAAHDAKVQQLAAAHERIRELHDAKNSAEAERDALRVMVENLGKQAKSVVQVDDRSETSYQHMVAALLDCIAGNLPNIEKHPSFESEAKLIDKIDDFYRGYRGLSKSNLSRKFPEAKRRLREQDT
ncbi:hypothetical protein GZH52_06725 [Crenobacter sp. HX-7-9]|uniref:Uncharacterized protein n=1 Tax=Crenobacter caeni TaxID=2705474 RepID=A0A6B2KR13_9NEIS|nr:hypothetical protein [Crenobacter caeni]